MSSDESRTREVLSAAGKEFGHTDRAQWKIDRERFEAGRTLSEQVMDDVVSHIGRFLAYRLGVIWTETGQPPQSLVINVHVPGPLETEDDLLRAKARVQAALADIDLRLTMLRRNQ